MGNDEREAARVFNGHSDGRGRRDTGDRVARLRGERQLRGGQVTVKLPEAAPVNAPSLAVNV